MDVRMSGCKKWVDVKYMWVWEMVGCEGLMDVGSGWMFRMGACGIWVYVKDERM